LPCTATRWRVIASNTALTPSRLSLVLLAVLALPAQGANEFYCCQSPQTTRRVCGDTLPPACRAQAYRVYDRAGNPIRDVAPPPSAEEKQALIEAAQQQKRDEENQREQRRRDQALLDTYALPADIDMAQKKTENDIQFAIQAAQSRIEATLQRRRKLDNEVEFYKKRSLPPELERDMKALNHEIQLQQELIAVKEGELRQIRDKYTVDRQRYQELTGRRPAGSQRPR